MVAGVALLVICGMTVFIGIPAITYITYTVLSSKETTDKKGIILLKSILIAIGIVVILLVIIWIVFSVLMSNSYT